MFFFTDGSILNYSNSSILDNNEHIFCSGMRNKRTKKCVKKYEGICRENDFNEKKKQAPFRVV